MRQGYIALEVQWFQLPKKSDFDGLLEDWLDSLHIQWWNARRSCWFWEIEWRYRTFGERDRPDLCQTKLGWPKDLHNSNRRELPAEQPAYCRLAAYYLNNTAWILRPARPHIGGRITSTKTPLTTAPLGTQDSNLGEPALSGPAPGLKGERHNVELGSDGLLLHRRSRLSSLQRFHEGWEPERLQPLTRGDSYRHWQRLSQSRAPRSIIEDPE